MVCDALSSMMLWYVSRSICISWLKFVTVLLLACPRLPGRVHRLHIWQLLAISGISCTAVCDAPAAVRMSVICFVLK
eukprot:4037822-Amphidinium_carterae.2